MPTISFKTIGCRLNQYDTEWLRESFNLAGFESVDSDSEICIVNTCAVTSKACREARNIIRSEIKRGAKVIVTGCAVKLNPQEFKEIKGVYIVEPEFPELVNKFLKLELPQGIKTFYAHNKAFIKVQEGCDQFCSYCIVPYVREKTYDRPEKNIISEIKELIKNGYQEFILTGTNLGKYKNLLGLLKSIDKISGIRRLGLSSIEPYGISDDLIDFFASSQKFSRYFHIPLQSGDAKILKLMNRWYAPEDFLSLVTKISSHIPDVAIGTDVIIGFPGEGETEFLNTYNFISQSPIARLHTFRYSKRPLTKALELKNKPQDKIVKQRSQLIYKLGEKKWVEFRTRFIGKILEAHIENEKDSPNKKLYTGVTSNYIKVLFPSDKELSGFANIRIDKISGSKTIGTLVM